MPVARRGAQRGALTARGPVPFAWRRRRQVDIERSRLVDYLHRNLSEAAAAAADPPSDEYDEGAGAAGDYMSVDAATAAALASDSAAASYATGGGGGGVASSGMTIHMVVPEATRHRLFAKRRTQAIERGAACGMYRRGACMAG